ncbi:MAG: glycosyltransferase [Pseudomonadota bacterium]
MKEPILEKNLEALALSQPALAERLKKCQEQSDLTFITSHSGQPVIIKNGTSLHSRHDPLAEAFKFADSEPVKQARSSGKPPVIFGMALGYHLRAAADFFQEIAVYEPDPAVVLSALKVHDWRDLLPRFRFYTRGDDLSELIQKNPALIVHRPSERVEPAECARLKAILKQPDQDRVRSGHPKTWKIMVVTPISGGSLPSAYHVVRALKAMGHEVIEADMSHLNPFYQSFRYAPMPQNRRDDVGRRMIAFAGEYLAFLAEYHRPHLLLALAQAPLDPRTLAKIRSLGVLTAFWFVEDHRYLRYFRELASSYDFFFHIQGREMEQELRSLGVRHYCYLPLAADPDLFRPLDSGGDPAPYSSDLSFMGAGYPNRVAVFSQLLDYQFKIWGTEWDLSTELGRRVQEQGRRIPTQETVFIYNAAKINLNLHSSVFAPGLDPEGGFINPRTFEIASCGAFQLVDKRRPLSLHFLPEEEIATFSDLVELRNKIDFYLAHPEDRREFGLRARKRVLAEHTYAHRLESLLEFVSAGGA